MECCYCGEGGANIRQSFTFRNRVVEELAHAECIAVFEAIAERQGYSLATETAPASPGDSPDL